MKNTLALVAFLLVSQGVFAQIDNHVKWGYAVKRTSPTEATIFIRATIDDDWHIYSQHIEEGGPTKTSFTFSPSKQYTLVGKTIEPKAIIKFDKYFKMNIGVLKEQVVFQQKIKLKSPGAATVKVKLRFGVCNDKTCLPPDDAEFNVPVARK